MHAPRHTHPLPPPLDPRNRHTTSPSSSELTRLFPPFLPPPSLPCSYLRPSARASTACASTAANPAAVPRPLLGPPPPDLWHSRADSQGSRSQEAHEPSGSAQGVDARQAWWCAPGSPLHCLTNATSSPLGFRHTGAYAPKPSPGPHKQRECLPLSVSPDTRLAPSATRSTACRPSSNRGTGQCRGGEVAEPLSTGTQSKAVAAMA